MAKTSKEDPGGFDHNVDRYLTLRQALTAIQKSIDNLDVPIERVEVTAQANGEANCRWFEPRALEPDIVHIPAPGSP